MRVRLLLAFLVALLPASSLAAAPACDDHCLLGIADAYLDALADDDPAGAPLARTVHATENGVLTAPGEGVWKTARGWTYRHTFVDPEQQSIGAFGIVAEDDDKKAMVAIRLKVADHRVVESEINVARQGDFSLFNPVATDVAAPFLTYLPPDRRTDRATLKAIAKSYFNGISHGDASAVPFHPDCNRVENGVRTTNSPPRIPQGCSAGLARFVYMQHMRQMRFPVIDTARGLVWAVLAVDMPLMTRTLTIKGKTFEISPERQHLPRTLFLYELFKVEDGRIRAIEAYMRNMPLGADMGWPGEGR